ncbi:hypothetical protein ES703_62251 [subsurface metagenome]
MKDDTRHRPLYRGELPHVRRITQKNRKFIKACVEGAFVRLTAGREKEFVRISNYDVQRFLRDEYFILLNYNQVGYLIVKLVKEGRLLREFHNRDRTATSCLEQATGYKYKKLP